MAMKVGRAAMLFAPRKRGYYEIHYLLPSDLRGKEGLAAVRLMVNEVFTKHRARAILGTVPCAHMPSRVFSRALGALPNGTGKDASGRDSIHYILERENWAGL